MRNPIIAWLGSAVAGLVLSLLVFSPEAAPAPLPATYWQVEELRPGMKGYGRSVFKGATIERFDAEVLGVLKNTSPGRDLILMRLSGCNLEKTGVIAGMSGSPIYIDNKLVGAVSYAWPFGTEPIAGVTPFSQMVEYVESFERRDLAKRPRAVGQAPAAWPVVAALKEPAIIGGRRVDVVAVSQTVNVPLQAGSGMPEVPTLVSLQCPLSAAGFTQHSLELLCERLGGGLFTPVQAGSAASHLLKDQPPGRLEPGAPLAISLVSGDFDLSGIGTVTHVEGERVYGWGHPFMSVGQCDFPLMTGYIHAIYPRRSVSFKMGSPLHCVGVINADVSTGIAGWLGRKPDLMPLKMTVRRDPGLPARTYDCELVRQRAMMPQLVYTTLTNSVDQEGDLPEELTAEMEVRMEFDDRPPLVLRDTFSGSSYSGGRAPAALYSQIASMVHTVVYNPFELLRVNRIECATQISPGRRAAEIENVFLESEVYSPGETLRAYIELKPYKGAGERVAVELKLPADLPPGTYTAQICDDLTHLRQTLRDSPTLYNPTNLDQVLQGLELQASAKRTHVVVRVPVTDAGVAVNGQELPNLPASMVELLANTRRTGAQTVNGALVGRQPTSWVISGTHSVKFAVTKNKRLSTIGQ